MSSASYFPRYRVAPGASSDPAVQRWLAERPDGRPLGLVAVADICATIHVEATLFDAAGRVVGQVDTDGSWRLSAKLREYSA